MAFITADRVKDTSTTTGTGSITVSGAPPTGYRTFSTVLSAGDTFYYCIQGQGTSEWEVGLGTYSSANVFARTTVLSSSNSGSAVSFSSGIKNVFITLAAAKTLQIGPSSSVTVPTVIGGTAASSSLTLQSTSGVGTTDSILFKVGNNGATTAMTIDTSGNASLAANLTFSGTAQRITGDFSNATAASRLMFQSSTTNGNTNIEAIPNGTGTVAVFRAFGNQDPTNASFMDIRTTAGTDGRVSSSRLGTGTYLPMTLYTGGSERMRIDTSGNVGVGGTPAYKFDVVKGSAGDVARFTNGVDASLVVGAPTGGITYDQLNGGYQSWQIASSEKMRIDSSGNVGIGTSSPNASAILDAQSTTKGVRFPNMTTTQKNAVSSPAAGLVVFDTTLAKLCVYSGSAWQTITSI